LITDNFSKVSNFVKGFSYPAPIAIGAGYFFKNQLHPASGEAG